MFYFGVEYTWAGGPPFRYETSLVPYPYARSPAHRVGQFDPSEIRNPDNFTLSKIPISGIPQNSSIDITDSYSADALFSPWMFSSSGAPGGRRSLYCLWPKCSRRSCENMWGSPLDGAGWPGALTFSRSERVGQFSSRSFSSRAEPTAPAVPTRFLTAKIRGKAFLFLFLPASP